jgi:stage II sporulation protein D
MRFALPGGKIFGGACLSLILIFFASCMPFMMKNSLTGGSDAALIRILLLRTNHPFTVTSGASFMAKGIDLPAGTRSFTIRPEEVNAPIILEPGNSPLILNGSPYRGALKIIPNNGSVNIVNIINIDAYLSSVVPGEIPSGWEPDALKAQAVAARTYAYYHLINNRKGNYQYDLDATTMSQVYRGIADEKTSTTEAVNGTQGEIILYDERPILAYFHSTCGGKTTDDKYVWSHNTMPYLKSVTCGYCNDSTKYKWESILSLEEIKRNLSTKYHGIANIRSIKFRKKNDRVTEVYIRHAKGNIIMSGNNFRLMFPSDKIRSLYFDSKKTDNGLLLSGHGWGHGVGMCQWGARGMARSGFNYHDILKHYYTQVRISSIRNGYVASKIKTTYSYQ